MSADNEPNIQTATNPDSNADSTERDASPVALSFNGTEGTEFDERDEHEHETVSVTSPAPAPVPRVNQSELTIQTTTTNPNHPFNNLTRSDEDEPPQSVIHAPPGFGEFPIDKSKADRSSLHSGLTSERSAEINFDSLSPPSLTTAIAPGPAKEWSERATPRAQTRQEFDEVDSRTHFSGLEDIPEGFDGEGYRNDELMRVEPFLNGEAELNALRTALAECWTLCNTLASLSYINRGRQSSNGDNLHENAWRSCWRLCQKLYDSQEDDYASQVNPTLDLCRDFCQALFDVRIHENEVIDSVLRVSFELNNHLYNTHDRNLPEAFRERTLDFYITLCHRLMKQRTRLLETDSLLSACWSLAEMLFSIRQSKREGMQLDEELLGSAVQACWELCDIFREGWTQRSLRSSDRGTPRPSQATFTQNLQHTPRSQITTSDEDTLGPLGNPETPTTIFEDTATVSPDEGLTPNILVLGQSMLQASHSKWSSNASNISSQTKSSGQSSTNTVKTLPENPNLTTVKVLIAKAATDSGFLRDGSQTLSSFVKSLPSDSFGTMPWQMSLLKNYKKLVAFDPAFRNSGPQARANAVDIARAVQAMVQNGQYTWLRDLYRLVFGFHLDEAMSRSGIVVQG